MIPPESPNTSVSLEEEDESTKKTFTNVEDFDEACLNVENKQAILSRNHSISDEYKCHNIKSNRGTISSYSLVVDMDL